MVYFIQAGLSGPIKIGVANNPKARLHTFQVGHYEELRLLAAIEGAEPEEAALHRRFASLRIRGEWFRPARALLEEIAKYRMQGGIGGLISGYFWNKGSEVYHLMRTSRPRYFRHDVHESYCPQINFWGDQNRPSQQPCSQRRPCKPCISALRAMMKREGLLLIDLSNSDVEQALRLK